MPTYVIVFFGIATVIIIMTAVTSVISQISVRTRELKKVNEHFLDQMVKYPPQPLTKENVITVKNIMDDDHDLWLHLNCGYDAAEREAHYKQVLNIGRYLNVFDIYAHATIHYGVFETNDGLQLRVWIEFCYQRGTVWVLSVDGGTPKIEHFIDYRVNHPGLVYRRFIRFEDGDENADSRWPV